MQLYIGSQGHEGGDPEVIQILSHNAPIVATVPHLHGRIATRLLAGNPTLVCFKVESIPMVSGTILSAPRRMPNTYAQDQARPTLTVDVIIPNGNGEVLVIRRGHAPFEGMWCLPGGMVDPGETLEAAAVREVKEETGLDISIERVHGIYSASGRDPRGHYVSVTMVAGSCNGAPTMTEEATEWKWIDPRTEFEMAFDHARILKDLMERPSTNVVLA